MLISYMFNFEFPCKYSCDLEKKYMPLYKKRMKKEKNNELYFFILH